jgi:hydrogenase-1 operon protein HyaF
MAELADIPIQIEQRDCNPSQYGNAMPILSEIRHALARLAEQGEPTRIDLAAMPFGPGDEERLLNLLGRGEVEANVEALGPTQIWETRFAGVWVLDYANVEGERIALQIEVDTIPQLLRADPTDVQNAVSALAAELATLTAAEPNADAT